MLSMTVIVYCSDLHNSCSYHEVLSSLCGPKAKLIVAADIAVATYGVCIAYLVIIGDQYDRIFASLVGPEFCRYWYLDRRFTIAVTGLFIYPICLLKSLDFLRHTGPLGIFSMLYVVFLTVYEHYALDHPTPVAIKTSPDNYIQLLACIPVICFGYQCNEVIVPIYASLKERNLKNFFKAAALAWTVLVVLYCTVGTYGYLTFGSSVSPNVMTMFNASDPLVLIGILALIFKMAVTYPQMAFAGREASFGIYKDCVKTSDYEFEKNEKSRRVKTTTIWFFSSLLLSAYAPHIGIVLELLGTLAAFNVFICPAVCLICLSRRHDLGHSSFTKCAFVITAILLAVVGSVFFCLVLYQTVVDIDVVIQEGSKSLCVL
jgi:sodium-coupled neutral amino acid transporter 7/8